MEIRPATAADAEVIAAIVVECDETFAEWAPAWAAPAYDDELERVREALASPERWVFAAEIDGEVVGYAGVSAAATSAMPVDEPGLGHLGRLYVRPSHWGTGVADALHERALAELAARGFDAIRLFTPTEHARARRFYEREGWRAGGEHMHPRLGLPMTEYRRDL